MGQAVSGLSNDEVRCCLPWLFRLIKVDVSSNWMFFQEDVGHLIVYYFYLLKGLG